MRRGLVRANICVAAAQQRLISAVTVLGPLMELSGALSREATALSTAAPTMAMRSGGAGRLIPPERMLRRNIEKVFSLTRMDVAVLPSVKV